MPTIDFYLIAESTPQQTIGFTCRLVEKAYQQKRRIFLYVESEEQAKQLDDSLWTFRDISFIPHARCEEMLNEDIDIQISHAVNPSPQQNDILINLTRKVPEFFKQFERVIEIVANDQQVKKAGREKFRFYRELGAAPNTHDLINKNAG